MTLITRTVSEQLAPWRLVHCRTGSEFDVSERLGQLGFETYVPRVILKRRVPHGRNDFERQNVKALFPSYQMARISQPDARLDRLARNAVRCRVDFQRALSEALIAFVKETEKMAEMLVEEKIALRPGAFAYVLDGVLKNEPVQVLKMRRSKCVVRLTQFAGSRSIEIDARLLAAVN